LSSERSINNAITEIGFSVREEPRMIDDSAYRTCGGMFAAGLTCCF